MNVTDTERWLMDYLAANGKGLPDDPEELLTVNYFEIEAIDSLGLVIMIGDIEREYGVQLHAEQLQDPRICTIRGFAEIVDEARAA